MIYITEGMIYSTMKFQMSQAQNNWFYDMSHTEKRILNAEDDPDNAATVSVLKDSLEQIDGMKRVATDVDTRITSTFNAVQGMAGLLNQVLVQNISAGNGTLNPEDRVRIANVVGPVQDQFLQLANATNNGRYLFAGSADNAPPYTIDGTYSGDTVVNSLEVAPSLWCDANLPGPSVVGNTGDATNILAVLNNLVTALNNNDADGIRTGLSAIKTAHDQITLAQARLGGPQETLDYAAQLRASLGQSLQEQRTVLEEQDEITGISDMMRSSTVMQAAIAVSQQVIGSLNAALNRG